MKKKSFMKIEGKIPGINNKEITINRKSVNVENESFAFNFHLFKKGGGLEESTRLNIPVLAEIPYSEDLKLSIDREEPLVQSNADHSVSEIFINIAKSLVKKYE